MIDIEIDSEHWGKGMFLNSSGDRCAIGFLLKSVGLPDEVLLHSSGLADVEFRGGDMELLRKFSDPRKSYATANKWVWDIMAINDSRSGSKAARIKAMNDLANPHGYNFVLKGKSDD